MIEVLQHFIEKLFRIGALDESMAHRIRLTAKSTIWVICYTIQVKFFLGNKYPLHKIKIKFFKVYMTDFFFICSIKFPQCTEKNSKTNFSIAIFFASVLMYQKRQISLPVGYKTARPTRRLGMIVTSFQDWKLC